MAKLLTETADYNEPGSWGRMSEGWPEITGPKAKDYRTFAACVKSIPYGSYVWIDQGWRGAPRDALRVHIDHIETLLKDFKDAGEPTSETSVAMREKLGKLNSTGNREEAPQWWKHEGHSSEVN